MSDKKVSYADLHKHVVEYSKTGSSDAALFILNAFNRTVWLYVHLICDKSNFKLHKRRHREFISLYCPRFVLLGRDQWRHNSSIKNFLLDAAQHVTYIHRKYEPEDIYSECQVVLLQMASTYKVYDRPTFHTLIDRLYYKKLFSRLKVLSSDPFVRKDNIEFDSNISDNYNNVMSNCAWHGENSWYKDFEDVEKQIDFDLSVDKEKQQMIEDNDKGILNLDWLNGVKGNDIFKELTRTEREILKLYYYDNLTDKEVSERLGYCMSTINKKRNKIIDTIRDKYKGSENI